MTWDTVNVLTISCAGEIAGKLAGKILDVLKMYQAGTCWVHYPFPCNVLVMYWLRTPPLAPSDCKEPTGYDMGELTCNSQKDPHLTPQSSLEQIAGFFKEILIFYL